MKPPVKVAVAILVTATVAVALGWRWLSADKVIVRLYTVETGQVAATVANTRAGTVKACQRARLAPNAGGQVTVLNVTEGSRVKRGDTLMELWHADLNAQLSMVKTQALAASGQSQETCLRAQIARRDARRLQDLRSKDFVSEEQLDQAITAAEAAEVGCKASKDMAAAAAAQIAVTEQAIVRTLLVAPFDGVVAEVNAELGEFITPSPTGIQTLPAVDLIDDTCLFISAPIDEVDAPNVNIGMPARITMDAYAKRVFAGTVRRIAPYVLELEKQARTVEVEANFDGQDLSGNLLVGYSADLEVVLAEKTDALRIPTESLMEGDRVYVVDDRDVVRERAVTVGLRNWEFCEILEGVAPGERVVLNPGREGVAAGVRAQPQAE